MGRICRNGMNVPFYTTDGDQKQIKPSSRGKKTKRNMNVSQRLEDDEVYFRNYMNAYVPCFGYIMYKWKMKIQLLVNKLCTDGVWLDHDMEPDTCHHMSSSHLVRNIVIGGK